MLARAWNYVFGASVDDEGYGSEGEDCLVGPIGGREEGEDADPNDWTPPQWGPYVRAAGPPLGNASGGGRSGEEGGDRDGRGSAARVAAGGEGAALGETMYEQFMCKEKKDVDLATCKEMKAGEFLRRGTRNGFAIRERERKFLIV